eukprot:gene23885-25477_t
MSTCRAGAFDGAQDMPADCMRQAIPAGRPVPAAWNGLKGMGVLASDRTRGRCGRLIPALPKVSEPGRQSRAVARTVAADRDFAGNPIARFDQQTVLAAYSRWAPIYDFVFAKLFFFGAFFDRGRELAIEHINTRTGTVLEVGVGTGVALGRYAPHLAVTGIDLSPDMLAVARKSVVRGHMSHVRELREMDAGALEFPDDSFDTVAVMYTISV